MIETFGRAASRTASGNLETQIKNGESVLYYIFISECVVKLDFVVDGRGLPKLPQNVEKRGNIAC